MKNIYIKDILISFCLGILIILATALVLVVIHEWNLVTLLNICFFEGSALTVISAVLLNTKFGRRIFFKDLYEKLLPKEEIKNGNGLFLGFALFITALTIFGIMFALHFIFKPLY
ncbi:MAG: hypothetical protein KBI30_00535 [Candidatus Atribacteria bacterium]|nr:hypothetical protein [Candidatus Atribacteria bacterium]